MRAVATVRAIRGAGGSAAVRGAACAALTASLLGAAPPAEATAAISAASAVGGHRHAVLVLSVHDGAGASGPVTGAAELICAPDTGSHPDPAAACGALTRAHGRLDRIPGDLGVCPMIYRPATAVARGHWGARPVRFAKTYSNACRLHQALTPVYDF